MNHHENHEQHELETEHQDTCCGGGCCSEDGHEGSNYLVKIGFILQWIFLGGAFVCSLLTLLLLPKIIKKQLVNDQALKAGGIENYDKLNREIYETDDFKQMMKQQVDMFIQQNKSTMEMYKQQAAQPEGGNSPAMEESTGATNSTGVVVK